MNHNLESSHPVLHRAPLHPAGWQIAAAACRRGCARRAMWLAMLLAVATPVAQAQDAGKTDYINAIQLIPDTAAGLMRIPNMPKFCNALDQTHAGQLRDEELVKPFFDAQRERIHKYLGSTDNNIAVTPEDLYEIASGEVVLAWLPFPNDKRRPYSLLVMADIRGRRDKADAVLQSLEQDLKNGGWIRKDVTHQGETVRIYDTKPKPGQLKVNQIAISVNDTRIITADRDSVITGIIDAESGKSSNQPMSEQAEFKKVLSQCGQAIAGAIQAQGGTLALEWFAKPFAMGRIVRESLEIDRGNDIDILKLLENQGFDAIRSAGGIVAINGTRYDMLQKGVILANRPFANAARMLQFDAGKREPIPAWVGPNVGSFNRFHPRIEEAFWASGSLIDEALGDKVFDDMINDIHKDKNGPQIDIKNNVLPSFDNEVILLTDNVLPADVTSERMLVAIRLNDAAKLKTAIQKAMEVEPDANKIDTPDLTGIDVWQVEPGQGGDESFDEELFGEFEFEAEETDQAPPLLDKWAIAVVPQGPGSTADYLIFSSHPEFLIESARRIQQGAQDGLGTLPEVQNVVAALQDLGIEKPIFDRVVRTKISLRIKYELLRQNKLRESDSVLAKLIQRIADEEADQTEPDPLQATKLPPIEKIEKYLSDGGSYLEETEDGWVTTGFLLK
jgi:hypothetical protein